MDENGPFVDGVPIENVMFYSFVKAILNNQTQPDVWPFLDLIGVPFTILILAFRCFQQGYEPVTI